MSIAIMTAVWRLDIPTTDKMVLLALADAANDDGVTWIALKHRNPDNPKMDLLKKTSLSERAVQGAVKRLIEAGYLDREIKQGKGIWWFVTPAPAAARTKCTPAPAAPDPRTTCTQTVSNRQSKEDIVVSEEPTLSPSPRRSYPDAFDEVWKAYPHHKGRSSKPKALAEWKRMPAQERDGLMGAIQAFSRNVDKVCGGMGAPCMARWMNHGKHLNWIEDASPTTSPSPSFVKTWNGPDRLRDMVVRERGEGFAVSYIDRATWDGEAILAHNDLAVEKLKDVRCLTGVVIKNSA